MESVSLLDYWRVVRKRLWLLALLAVLGTAASAYVSLSAVPQYRSTTTLFLNPAAANPLLPYQNTKTVLSVANTYIEFMRTRSYAGLVVQQSGLQISEAAVLRSLSTQYVEDTQFFRITATFTDPATAQLLANTAAQVLIAENSARQQAEQDQIALQRNRNPEVQQLTELRDSLKQQIELYNQRVISVQEEVADLQLRSATDRNQERLDDLQDELLALQQARSQTLVSLAQAQASLVANGGAPAAQVDTAVVVDAAPPGVAISNDVVQRIGLGLVVGLVLGAGLAFALEYLDFTVRSPEQLEVVYGQMALGVIGRADGRRLGKTRGSPAHQLTLSDPQSPLAEAVRSLRTSVQVAGMSRNLGALMVTSAAPGEGKTFVATNLAVAMAQAGSAVILVDLDLRKPTVHGALGLKREPGFTDLVIAQQAGASGVRPRLQKVLRAARNGPALRQRYLSGEGGARAAVTPQALRSLLREVETDDAEALAAVAELRKTLEARPKLEQFLQSTAVDGLRVLSCGVIPPNPAELLGSPQAAQVMEQLRDHADVVIYDTPPAATVTDAVVVAQLVDGVIHVVQAGKTRIDLVRRSKALLEQTGVAVIGPVLNQVQARDLGYSQYYYHGYYGEGEAKKRGWLPWRRTQARTVIEAAQEQAPARRHRPSVTSNGHLPAEKLD